MSTKKEILTELEQSIVTMDTQTETETAPDEGIPARDTMHSDQDTPVSQTEANFAEIEQLDDQATRDPGPETPSDQTELEPLREDAAGFATNPDTPDDSQTEEKPKRKRASSEKKAPKTSGKQEDDSGPSDLSEPEEASAASSESDKDNPEPAKPASRQSRAPRRRPRSEPVVSIDEVRTVQTTEDKLQNDLLDLVESMKGRKILSGTIQGVERSDDNPNMSFAVIYHGEFKVIIPAEETVEPPADFRDRLPGDVMHYLVTKRLGAEVDFIVKGIDANTGIAAASRLEAMAAKRRTYYYGTDRDGNNLLYEGISAEARVVSVIRAGIFVDLFGVESYIPLRELSYQRWVDAGSHYQAGQRVLTKVLTIDRSDRNNIKVTASVKQAGENPYEKALRRYSVGSRYVGTVSMVDTNGVFVSLDGGIDCLCSYPKRGRPPRGSRVTVRILGINHDSNRIWGAITHMTSR